MENKNVNTHDVEEQRIALKEPLNNTALNETRDSAYSAHTAYSRGEHKRIALKEALNNTALNETRESAYSAHSAESRGEHNKVRGEDKRWMGYMF
jgi:hypothetical protein